MLENLIERSSKAWGLGQKSKFCFSPARGSYFSIKGGQNPNVEGSHPKGSASWEGGGGLHGAHIFRENAAIMFFIDFEAHFVKFFGSKIDLGAHFGRLLRSETRFGRLVRPAVCA